MKTRIVQRRFIALTAALLGIGFSISAARATPADVPSQTVRFAINYVTTFGDSVFIVGDIPELGSGDIRKGVKLVPGTYVPGPPASLVWSIDIAIPYGTTTTYRFYRGNDDVAALTVPGTFTAIGEPVTITTTIPVPATRDRIIYAPTSESTAAAIFQIPGGYTSRPFLPLYGRSDLKAAVLWNRPNGPGIDAQFGGGIIDSPLHRLFFRNAAAFNYEPVAAPNSAGTKETFALPTALIPSTRTVNNITGRGIQVWLPRGYALNTAKRYPVLYMHDGQNVFVPGGPFGTWQAEVTTAQLIQRARVREIIIVAIDNSSQRSAEYVPEFANSTVNNTRYNQFIVGELKPYIDANYRTLPGRETTAVAGSSFGGIASCVLALDQSATFGRVGVFSPSFWAGNTKNRVTAGGISMSTRVYMDAGDTSDDGDITLSVRDALLARGRVLNVDLFFQIGLFQQHNEAAWSQRFPQMLDALFPISEETALLDALPTPLMGDFNGDGCIELSDLSRLLAAFGTCSGAAAFDTAADLDASTCVDLADLAALLGRFGLCQ